MSNYNYLSIQNTISVNNHPNATKMESLDKTNSNLSKNSSTGSQRVPSSERPKRNLASYKKLKELGSGANGVVYLASCEGETLKYAIKQIDIKDMNIWEKNEIFNEVRIQRVMHHPNVVLFRETYNSKKGMKVIVMEYAEGMDFEELIYNRMVAAEQLKKPLEQFKEAEIFSWFTQALLGLKHIHDRKVLHRDIKTANIMRCKNGIIKLSDFGVSKKLKETMAMAKTQTGSPVYMSPEIVQGQPYNAKTDVWSLGIVLYELCQFDQPFTYDNQAESPMKDLNEKIMKGEYEPVDESYSQDMHDLIGSMLTLDPNQRPSVNQLITHPRIQQEIKTLTKLQIYKDEFAKGLLINDTYFDSYKEFKIQEGLDEKTLNKAEEFDKFVDADDHGHLVGKFNNCEPSEFCSLYSTFIKSNNPYRKPIFLKKPEAPPEDPPKLENQQQSNTSNLKLKSEKTSDAQN